MKGTNKGRKTPKCRVLDSKEKTLKTTRRWDPPGNSSGVMAQSSTDHMGWRRASGVRHCWRKWLKKTN